MKIAKGLPPNYKEIKEKLNPNERTVFTYGDTIYVQNNEALSIDLMAHEETHAKQQKDPKKWWNEYLNNPDFRVKQELEAYREQYKVFCSVVKDRNNQAKFASKIASDLSSELYGKPISYVDALTEIRK